jgi:hemolysin III
VQYSKTRFELIELFYSSGPEALESAVFLFMLGLREYTDPRRIRKLLHYSALVITSTLDIYFLTTMQPTPNYDHKLQTYSPLEEQINIYTHGFGALFSIIALVFLTLRGAGEAGALPLISFTVFGVSLVLLYTTSTLYHRSTNSQRRQRLRIFDHATIYVLIAGTYTPFCLLTLPGRIGWTIFLVSWGMALTGIVLKVFFTGRFRLLSTLMYVFMGWLIVFAYSPLAENLPATGLLWLIAGGVSYSLGAVLYSIRKLPLNHAVFHCFVLLGSACHFMAVYFYVLE